jgi:uncharacterized lipoprotein YehR (DUF1307 family)
MPSFMERNILMLCFSILMLPLVSCEKEEDVKTYAALISQTGTKDPVIYRC